MTARVTVRTARSGLRLRPLEPADETRARAAHRELAADGFEFLLGDLAEDADAGASFAALVDRLELERQGRDLPEGRVPATFLVAVVGDDLVGRVSIRHELNEYLARVGGHIGYAVRPASRRRGFGVEILRQALGVAREVGLEEVLVTCDVDNVASIAVIERCGGVLMSVVDVGAGHVPKRHYRLQAGVPTE